MTMENPLAPHNNVVYLRPNIIQQPRGAAALQQFSVTSLLDHARTGLPRLDVVKLIAVSLGPYQGDLARQYITRFRFLEVEAMQVQPGLHLRDQLLRQLPADIQCWYFDQVYFPP